MSLKINLRKVFLLFISNLCAIGALAFGANDNVIRINRGSLSNASTYPYEGPDTYFDRYDNVIISGSLNNVFLIQVGENTYFEKISLDNRFDLKHEYQVAKALESSAELNGFLATAVNRRFIRGKPSYVNYWSLWTKAYHAGSLAHIITAFTRKEINDPRYDYSEHARFYWPNLPKIPEEAAHFYLANAAMLLDRIHRAGYSWGNIKPNSFMVDQDGYLAASNFVNSRPLTKDGNRGDWRMLGIMVAESGLRMSNNPDVKILIDKIRSFEEFKQLRSFAGLDWDALAKRELRAPFLNFVEELTEQHLQKLIYIIPEASDRYQPRSGSNGSVTLLKIGSKIYAEKLLCRHYSSIDREFGISKYLETKDYMRVFFVRAFSRGKKFQRKELNYFREHESYETMLMEAYVNGTLGDIVSRFTAPLIEHLRGAPHITFTGPGESYRYSECDRSNTEAYLQMPIMPLAAIRFYLANAALVLERLHRAGIAWNDAKVENFLVDQQGYLVAADFGISKRFHELLDAERAGQGDWTSLGIRVGIYAFRLDEKRRDQENALAIEAILALQAGKISNLSQFKELEFFADFDWSALENRSMPAPRI